MSTARTRRHPLLPLWAALATGFVGLGAGALIAGPAGGAPTSNLVFSVDGGTTWSANVNAAPGQTVIAREYYDNDTNGTIDGAQVTTTLPTGFSLIAGSTEVCLNPGTTDPTNPSTERTCNSDTGQGGAIDEAAVWTGNSLAISPTAGIYGQPTNQTTGPLAMGKTRYLNLNQCNFGDSAGASNLYTTWLDTSNAGGAFDAGTNVSNTTQASPNCGPGASGFVPEPVNDAVFPFDLLGHKYVNIDQCDYNSPNNYSTLMDTANSSGFFTGTDSSNTPQTTVTCGSGAGTYVYEPANSGVSSMDLLDNRYVNLDQCDYSFEQLYTTMVDTTNGGGAFDTGTGASNTAQTAVTCGAGAGGYSQIPQNSGFLSLDTLDPTRGQGFVQWSMTAPSPGVTTTYAEDGQLTGTGTGDPTTSGTITIDASVGTPLANPWVIGGGVGLVVVAGTAAVLIRRRRPEIERIEA